MLPSASNKEALLACLLFLLGICLPSQWSQSSPSHALTLIPPLTHQDPVLAHFDSLHPDDLVLWTDGSVPFPLGKYGSGVLANCSLCDTKATLSFSTSPVYSSFSAEACTILQALCWSWQHQQDCHLSSLFLQSDSHSSSPPCPLLHLSSCLKLYGRFGRNCLVFPFYMAKIGLQTLVSPGEQRS